jgi:hypothetical protein
VQPTTGVAQAGSLANCLPKLFIPEQINLQYGAADTIVAGFVT